MMKKIKRRLCTQSGETLLETLVSVMVVAVSSVVLLTAINGSAKINRDVRASDESYRQELETAERGGGTLNGQVTVKVSGATYTYDVKYAGVAGDLRSYDKVVSGP